MLSSTIIYCLLLVLPTDIQTIINDLSSNQYKTRKAARESALALNIDKKRILIKELGKSNDPELTETAKELKATLPEAMNKRKILIYVLEDKYEEINKAVNANPEIFKEKYDGNMNIVDIAKTLNKQKFVEIFEKAGIKSTGKTLKTMDVLVVESDTWESLANDFNANLQLIKLLNKDKELRPGVVITVPRGN